MLSAKMYMGLGNEEEWDVKNDPPKREEKKLRYTTRRHINRTRRNFHDMCTWCTKITCCMRSFYSRADDIRTPQ